MRETFALLYVFLSAPGFSAIVLGGWLNLNKDAIVLQVSYEGSFVHRHVFRLQHINCTDDFPVRCEFRLIEDINDNAPAGVWVRHPKEIEFFLDDLDLDMLEFRGAVLRVWGDENSKVQVVLS